MTLKAKTVLISLLVLVTVVFSFKLFIDYRALHNSMLTNLVASGDIVIAGSDIYMALTSGEMDIETARSPHFNSHSFRLGRGPILRVFAAWRR